MKSILIMLSLTVGAGLYGCQSPPKTAEHAASQPAADSAVRDSLPTTRVLPW